MAHQTFQFSVPTKKQKTVAIFNHGAQVQEESIVVLTLLVAPTGVTTLNPSRGTYCRKSATDVSPGLPKLALSLRASGGLIYN